MAHGELDSRLLICTFSTLSPSFSFMKVARPFRLSFASSSCQERGLQLSLGCNLKGGSPSRGVRAVRIHVDAKWRKRVSAKTRGWCVRCDLRRGWEERKLLSWDLPRGLRLPSI